MNRKQFLRLMAALGGAIALTPFLEGCNSPSLSNQQNTQEPGLDPPSPLPSNTSKPNPTSIQQDITPFPNQDHATVALVRTIDRNEGVQRAIELLGINPVKGKKVILKPNFNSAHHTPGSTHNDVLRSLISKLNEMGANSITVADRSGMGDTYTVMRQKGVIDLAEELDFQTVALDKLPEDEWEIINQDGFHWSQGFPVPKILSEVDCIVQTCNLKTHRYGGHFTLSLKNSVGFVAKFYDGYNYMNELHGTSNQRKMIAEINTAYQPAFIVMDGIEAFVDGGPDTGTKAATNVILAATDRIAIDAVGIALLRMFGTTKEVSQGTIFEQEQIARAVELNLGIDTPDRIVFATDDDDSQIYADSIKEFLLA
jgi:uncharacterized protein (DUF362 family)